MKNIKRNLKVGIVVLSLIFAGYFSASFVKAEGDGGDGGGAGSTIAIPTEVAVSEISTSSARVSWNTLENPATTTYRIFFSNEENQDITVADFVANNGQLTNLLPDTDYSFMIGPTEEDGLPYGATAVPLFRTLTEVAQTPSPTSLITTASTSNSITLQWNTNSAPLGTVYQISGDGFLTTSITSTDLNIASITIESLPTPDTQYTFNIQSQNANGSLNSSVTTSDYTKATNPINLSANNITTSTLTLNWDSNGNPSTTMYLIADNFNSLGVTNTTTFDISNLTPSTSYTFNVLSANNNDDNSQNQAVNLVVSTLAEGSNNKENTNNNSGNSNTAITDDRITNSVNKLISFLQNSQSSDGKIIDGGISDWSAIAFGSNNIYASDVKNGEKSLYDFIYNYNFTDASDLNLCASYPRHILALLASGVEKTDSKIVNLKNKINSDCVAEGIFGQAGINDDVFGLFSLLALDQDINSIAITTIISTIKNDQQPDGSFTWNGWPGADITGAAINVLKYAQSKGIEVDANIFSKAKEYLKNQQLADGGWGFGASDALTTGWAVMGINALGETQNDWFKSQKNPWHILTTLTDNRYIQSWDSATDWFGTKHAVPALLGKTWPIILDPRITNNTQNGSTGSSNTGTSTSTTTTIDLATSTTSTVEVATTTPTTTVFLISTTTVAEKISSEKFDLPINPVTPKLIAKKAVVEKTQPIEQKLTAGEPQKDNSKIVNDLPLDTPTKNNMRKLFELSTGGLIVLGIYVGSKIVRKMI